MDMFAFWVGFGVGTVGTAGVIVAAVVAVFRVSGGGSSMGDVA